MKWKGMRQIARPILFNTEMTRAVLDGRKTQTRRVIRPQPKSKLAYISMGHRAGKWSYPGEDAWWYWGDESFRLPDDLTEEDKDRYWTPPCRTGDILYVRETWAPMYPDNVSTEVVGYMYKADDGRMDEKEYGRAYPDGKGWTWPGIWRPSIHMPKKAARIFLMVTNVTVERLQDITPEECEQEGALISNPLIRQDKDAYSSDIRTEFSQIWDSTIRPKDRPMYGWDADPWVFVISFCRVEDPLETDEQDK